MSDHTVLPPRHPNFSYSVDYVGQEQQPVLVVDNFLEGAEALIGFAVKHGEFRNGSNFYPGIQARVPDFYVHTLILYLRDIIGATFGVAVEDIEYSKSMYSAVLIPPDKLLPTQCRPHTDSLVSSQLATVHYLCKPDKGGTALYRHRATGYETLDAENFARYETFLAEEERDTSWQQKYICGSNQYYEEIGSYEANFNRLIMYRGNCLHAPKIAEDFNFVPDALNGRLTLNTFIKCK